MEGIPMPPTWVIVHIDNFEFTTQSAAFLPYKSDLAIDTWERLLSWSPTKSRGTSVLHPHPKPVQISPPLRDI